MNELLERLEARLRIAGWQVSEQERSIPDPQTWISTVRWLLASRRPPLTAQVELRLRIFDRTSWEYWYEAYLVGATVRYPRADDSASDGGPEATLAGDEISRDNYRQLVRILEWFRDPLSSDYWNEPTNPDDWEPPIEWVARRWGHQATLDPRWGGCHDAQEMLRYMPGKPSDRKLRLIACACCRLMTLPALREANLLAIDAAERYAEGFCPRREVKKACKQSDLPWLAQLEPLPMALQAVRLLGEDGPGKAVVAANVVREIIGDPFRPVAGRREWLRNHGAAVAHLAETIAAEGRYEEMPILGDALEDAGCRDERLLDHCRSGDDHVRGCWVLDLLTGRK